MKKRIVVQSRMISVNWIPLIRSDCPRKKHFMGWLYDYCHDDERSTCRFCRISRAVRRRSYRSGYKPFYEMNAGDRITVECTFPVYECFGVKIVVPGEEKLSQRTRVEESGGEK